MIQPTIRCANPDCACEVSMAKAMRVGTRLYCTFHCANGSHEAALAPSETRSLLAAIRERHALVG